MGNEQDNQNEEAQSSGATAEPDLSSPSEPEEPSFGKPPGYIPEPKEKSWDAESPDAFDGVDRGTPFEGRPPSEVVQPGELPVERYDDPSPNEPIPPGQPLPRGNDGGSDGSNTP